MKSFYIYRVIVDNDDKESVYHGKVIIPISLIIYTFNV